MNKFLSLGAMLTIAAGATFMTSSCSSNDAPSNYESVKQQDFKQSFIKEFGNTATTTTVS